MDLKKVTALLLSLSLAAGLCACGQEASGTEGEKTTSAVADAEEKAYIEETLNLANNADLTWTYSASADAWVMSIVSAVAYPELPDQQGVSVCVPGAYVTGIDTDGDGSADVTGAESGEEAVSGSLVIDYEAEITSTNGQTYTAATAPIILNTGAAGYGSQNNSLASTTYAADGYINVSCGNRGKQDTATDEDGNTYYTGDAPSCLADQKAAARFIQYNILLGNLPGCGDYLISTGGSGGGAHAVMFAATTNNADFYDYQIEAGAVGVYYTADGGYSTAVTIDGVDYEISDGAWGCIAYSAITSLAEADMALAFEYYLDADYDFSTEFQAQLAEYLSAAYMEYINEQNLSVNEADAGTTQASGSSVDSSNYATYEEMVEAYRADIESIQAGDEYGNNLVELYNPLNYIGADGTENPTWVKILCGAAEGDISMFNSLNLQISMLNSGIDATIEWQWDGGHVPSEVLGDSFSLYVDQMYGEYVDGAAAITKAAPEPQTANGTADEPTGTDLTGWVSYENGEISFSLADAAAYRTAGASKAMPGFDVIDYGQEDYVFGTSEQDARHWDSVLLEIFETYGDTLSPLFNSGSGQ